MLTSPKISNFKCSLFQQMFETLENMQQIVAEYTTPAGEAQAIIGH
jgi:uncharacterized protein YecA (UPF0149 family)